jgi:hypothetical protein
VEAEARVEADKGELLLGGESATRAETDFLRPSRRKFEEDERLVFMGIGSRSERCCADVPAEMITEDAVAGAAPRAVDAMAVAAVTVDERERVRTVPPTVTNALVIAFLGSGAKDNVHVRPEGLPSLEWECDDAEVGEDGDM